MTFTIGAPVTREIADQLPIGSVVEWTPAPDKNLGPRSRRKVSDEEWERLDGNFGPRHVGNLGWDSYTGTNALVSYPSELTARLLLNGVEVIRSEGQVRVGSTALPPDLGEFVWTEAHSQPSVSDPAPSARTGILQIPVETLEQATDRLAVGMDLPRRLIQPGWVAPSPSPSLVTLDLTDLFAALRRDGRAVVEILAIDEDHLPEM